MALTLRSTKGSKLTIEEMDGNLTYLQGLSQTTIPLSNTVWVNQDLTENDTTNKIFISYDSAITWIQSNGNPSSENTWQVILPGGNVGTVKIYSSIRVDASAGTVIERLETLIVENTQIDSLSVAPGATYQRISEPYDNSTSGLSATTVQDAIDELKNLITP
jgi:hypothetical protein